MHCSPILFRALGGTLEELGLTSEGLAPWEQGKDRTLPKVKGTENSKDCGPCG